MSRIVLSQGDAPQFSHVGIVLIHHRQHFVIHAIPRDNNSSGGVIVEPLVSFASSDNASDIGIYRVNGLDGAFRQRIREYVVEQIGKPFDDEFLMSNSDKHYCAELVLKAFQFAGKDITPALPYLRVMLIPEPIMPPDYLRRSPLLEVIYRAQIDRVD